MAFVATGSLSLIWLILWVSVLSASRRRHQELSPAELAYIESDKPVAEKPDSLGQTDAR